MLISLKFIISDRLPKISYLTLLDIYLHLSYLIMMGMIIYTCAFAYTHSPLWTQGQTEVKQEASGGSCSEMGSDLSDTGGRLALQMMGHTVVVHEPYLLVLFSAVWILIHLGLGYVYYTRSWNV